ncbi:hypothetical protein PENSPDRAFT_650035 [Peniophora sp. CONT]|nr:hypothetical protein PENSPDRAFT_650035 [Peniophora sp. CONT]
MATCQYGADGPSSATERRFLSPALPSSSRILHRADGLAIAMSGDDDDEPISVYEDFGTDISSITTSNASVLPEPSHALLGRASPPPIRHSTKTSNTAKTCLEGQVAFGSHRRTTRRRASDALQSSKGKGKPAQRPRSSSYRRRSLDAGMLHAPRRSHTLEALLHATPRRTEETGHSGIIPGDRTRQRRCDPHGLDVTMEELALFDAMAAHASAAYRREEQREQAGQFSARPGTLAELEDNEDAAARDVHYAMQDDQLALHAAEPGATVGTPAIGLLVSPPNIPAHLEGSERAEDVQREEEAMVDIWRYIYSIIRRSPSQRMCAYVQVSADDTGDVLRQVAENGMSCTLHRRGTEWWVAVVDEEDVGFLAAFVERRMAEVGIDQSGRRVLKLPWGADPLVIDAAVRAATLAVRTNESALQWPIQYTTGRLHFLVAWLDLSW